MTTRLGFACISVTLSKHKICCNRTCRLATAIKKGVESGYNVGSPEYSNAIKVFLMDYGKSNIKSMYQIIAWSRKNGILFYRMSSDMFPHLNNLKIKSHLTPSDWAEYVSLNFVADKVREIGMYAQKYGMRLTMHPGHYNQIGSTSDEVFENTVLDLSWHARLLDLLYEGAQLYLNSRLDNVIHHGILCVHGGGTYKDKDKTIERWKENFKKLPRTIQEKIALENDERGYSVEDLLPICEELNIPLIFDFHHYNCWAYYHEKDPHQKPISELLPRILATWTRRNKTPKFHLSDQAQGKKVGAHHDYVESIPNELLALIDKKYPLDIMIEAKMKELATAKLYHKYKSYLY